MNATKQFSKLIQQDGLTIAPGVYDGISTKLVDAQGFDAMYASGGAIARSAGYPDLGLLSFGEVVERLANITDVTDLPVIADADTGFGNGLNVRRTTRTFEKLGLAGFHIEDQSFPKRCGHLDDKKLVSTEEMCLKISVAKDAVIDPDFTVIARTDAIAVEGFDQAIERASRYVAAGADMIFVEAPETLEQIEAIAREIKTPKLINMFYGGKTPLVPAEDLARMGYKLAIIPSDLQRAAIFGMQQALKAIKNTGDSSACANFLTTFAEREEIIETKAWLATEDVAG